MSKGRILERLVGTESLEDNRIGAFAVKLDPSIRSTDNGRHALPRRVEFADI